MNKRFIMVVCGITIVLLFGSILAYAFNSREIQNTLAGQQNEIYDLTNELDVKKAEAKANTTKLIESSTGLKLDRVSKDDEIAETFISSVLTWNDGTKYDTMRSNIMTEYGLTENDEFMRVFLPPNVKTADGVHNYIDTHKANCAYESMESYVTRVGTDVYSYFTFVTWSTSDMIGQEATSTCVFTYDINSDGKISNLGAYTMYN